MTLIKNLFSPLLEQPKGEIVEELLRGGEFRLERIVSTGQVTPPDQWYDQDTDEWVVLLSGAAKLRFEDELSLVELGPGDHLLIVAHRRHRVEWTAPDQETVWLALHSCPRAPAS